MNKQMLLNELLVQTAIEKNINDEMQKEIDIANQLIGDIKNDWEVFAKEVFPAEIIKVMARLDRNGNELVNTSGYTCANNIFPVISVGNLHIAFVKECIVFVQDQKTIGFYYRKDELLDWNSYPVTFWENLPMKISLKTSKQGMLENRKTIDLVYDFRKMFNDFQENLPKIYAEISRLNAEYIATKRKALVDTSCEEPKKYKITIEIEELTK
jgi:hypothetical protein